MTDPAQRAESVKTIQVLKHNNTNAKSTEKETNTKKVPKKETQLNQKLYLTIK